MSGILAFCSSVRGEAAVRLALVGVMAIAVVMDAVERLDAPFHRLRQVVVRRLLIREQRVAALLRHTIE
jgi:hypothetical protein